MKRKTGEKELKIAEGVYLLQKFPGKGGWTHIHVPAPEQLPTGPFGYFRVKGKIDDYKFSGLSIWSTRKSPLLFFPVNANIRSAIRKKAGDEVRVLFYLDEDEVELPVDFREVLEDDKAAMTKFRSLPKSRQRYMITTIEGAKNPDTRVKRMAEALQFLDKK
jgi:hypothetical protein